jgi:holo-[acyl-carrier protein] synthase
MTALSYPEIPPGGVVLGLGCDVVDVSRIRRALERQGERFLERVFTEEERAYSRSKAHPESHLAARFAAKEAVSKCFTTGIGAELGWKSVSVHSGTRSQPLVRLDEKGQALLRRVGATHVLLSLSHTAELAMAVAALVRAPEATPTHAG